MTRVRYGCDHLDHGGPAYQAGPFEHAKPACYAQIGPGLFPTRRGTPCDVAG